LVSPIDKLLDKQVIVYTAVATYQGILKEISEEAICLRGKTSWHEIPVDRIKEIRPKDQ